MGGKFSSDDSFGRVAVHTEHAQYTAGEQINGTVELHLKRPFPSNQIHLGFSAEERVAVVLAGGGGTDLAGGRLAVHTDSLPLFELRFPLFAAAGDSFTPGQHSFPFLFKLREDLPGSFAFTYDEGGQEGSAAIVYTVWAGLRDEHTDAAFFAKREVAVAQRPPPAQGARQLDFTRNLRGYCCAPLGRLALHCQLDADRVTAGAETLLSVGVDNSGSRAPVKAVQCRLVQTVQLRTGDGKASKTLRRVMFSQALRGCAAGERLDGPQAQLVRVGVDAGLQPSVRGALVRNEWCLELEAELDSFLCCDQQPPHAIAVTLCRAPTAAPLPPPAADWAPTTHAPFVCTETPDHLFSLRNAP